YQRRRLALRLLSSLLGMGYLVLIVAGAWDDRLWLAFPGRPLLGAALYFSILLLGYELLRAPLAWCGGWWLAHRYGLSRQSFAGWLWDWAKGAGLALALGLPAGLLLFAWMATKGEGWWWGAGLGAVLVGVVLTRLGPVLLVPLFFRLRPLSDAQLAARLAGLAEQAGTRVVGVYELELSTKSRSAGAALAGLGKTRRILLSDTLLSRFDAEEVGAVVAHELGHHAGRHIGKLILLQGALLLLGFYLAERLGSTELAEVLAAGVLPGSPSGPPLGVPLPAGPGGTASPGAIPAVALGLSLWGAILSPALTAYGRRLERFCDRFAVRLGGGPPFRRALEKLGEMNLADPAPPRWMTLLFYTHPPLAERMRLAGESAP
ncbi:MAG: M48 family metalloprotease, partial [Nitrospinota bacterium]